MYDQEEGPNHFAENDKIVRNKERIEKLSRKPIFNVTCCISLAPPKSL